MNKKTSRKSILILGIDPGTASTGWGLIKSKGGITPSLQLVDYGCIKTNKECSFDKRLHQIHLALSRLLRKHQPDIMAVEEIFFFKNAKTVIGVSQAQGVILLTAAKSKISTVTYTPLQVKQVLTKYGRSDKNQVVRKVKNLLRLKETPKPDDAADALAVAICHLKKIKK